MCIWSDPGEFSDSADRAEEGDSDPGRACPTDSDLCAGGRQQGTDAIVGRGAENARTPGPNTPLFIDD